MTKQNKFAIAFLITVGLLVVVTGSVFAHGMLEMRSQYGTQFYETDEEGGYWGPMHGRGRRWNFVEEISPVRTAMVEAMAEASGLSVEEINQRFDEGEHFIAIAHEAGLNAEDFFTLKKQVHLAYWEQAVEEGWITAERYQWMLERLEDDGWRENGFGGCHTPTGRFFSGNDNEIRGRRRRW